MTSVPSPPSVVSRVPRASPVLQPRAGSKYAPRARTHAAVAVAMGQGGGGTRSPPHDTRALVVPTGHPPQDAVLQSWFVLQDRAHAARDMRLTAAERAYLADGVRTAGVATERGSARVDAGGGLLRATDMAPTMAVALLGAVDAVVRRCLFDPYGVFSAAKAAFRQWMRVADAAFNACYGGWTADAVTPAALASMERHVVEAERAREAALSALQVARRGILQMEARTPTALQEPLPLSYAHLPAPWPQDVTASTPWGATPSAEPDEDDDGGGPQEWSLTPGWLWCLLWHLAGCVPPTRDAHHGRKWTVSEWVALLFVAVNGGDTSVALVPVAYTEWDAAAATGPRRRLRPDAAGVAEVVVAVPPASAWHAWRAELPRGSVPVLPTADACARIDAICRTFLGTTPREVALNLGQWLRANRWQAMVPPCFRAVLEPDADVVVRQYMGRRRGAPLSPGYMEDASVRTTRAVHAATVASAARHHAHAAAEAEAPTAWVQTLGDTGMPAEEAWRHVRDVWQGALQLSATDRTLTGGGGDDASSPPSSTRRPGKRRRPTSLRHDI